MKKISCFISVVILAVFSFSCAGQTAQDLLRKLKTFSDSKVIGYDYTIYLFDVSGNARTDSMKGKLYKEGTSYMDSNSYSICAMNGTYYCKMDYVEKIATVYDVKLLQKKLHLTLDDRQSLINIPDSAIDRYAKVKVLGGGAGTAVAVIHFTGYNFSDVRVEYQKTDYKIVSIQFEIDDEKEGDRSYKKIYYLRRINYQPIPGLLNLDRIFKMSGNKVVVNNKYSSYQLRTLNP